MPETNTHSFYALVLSIAALALGPLIHRIAQRERVSMTALDNFVLVAVVGLVLLEITPGALSLAGWPALIGLFLGLLAPSIAEGPLRIASQGTHKAAVYIAVLGMILHSFTDGLALAGTHSVAHQSHGLEIAIIAHQVPVSVSLWWLLSPGGTLRASLMLIGIVIATIAGFYVAEASLELLHSSWLGIFQALIGGLLLHVVVHRSTVASDPKHQPRIRIAANIGGLAGLGLLAVLMPGGAVHHHEGAAVEPGVAMVSALFALARESAPALLLGFMLAGLVAAYLPTASLQWLRRGSRLSQSLRGVVLGLPLPLCSCGVIPVYRSLVKRGIPTTAGFAFLVATPELGLDAILLSFPLLGLNMTLIRVLGAVIVAILVGWLVGGWVEGKQKATQPHHHAHTHEPAAIPEGVWRRFQHGLRIGFGEMVDSTGPWILFGLVLAALIEPWLQTESLTQIPIALQVALFGLLGVPLYVCAAGATPFVAVLLVKGLSPGAALALLLTGPATNATTFGLLRGLYGRRTALMFAGGVFFIVLVLGYAVDYGFAQGFVVEASPELHFEHEHAEDVDWLGNISLVLLAIVFLASFLRQGPRSFFAQIWRSKGEAHSHDANSCHTC